MSKSRAMPRKEPLRGCARRKSKERREALVIFKKLPKITEWIKVNVNEQPKHTAEPAQDDNFIEIEDSKNIDKVLQEEPVHMEDELHQLPIIDRIHQQLHGRICSQQLHGRICSQHE